MPKYKVRASGYVDVIIEAEDAYQAADFGGSITDEEWLQHGDFTIFYEPDDMPEEVK